MTTQNCAECGTRAEPGQSFCDACGAVLRWDAAGARAGTSARASTPAAADTGSHATASSASGPGPGAASASGPGPGPGSASGPGRDGFARPGGTGTAPPAHRPPAPDPDTRWTPDSGTGNGARANGPAPSPADANASAAPSGLPQRRPSGVEQDTAGPTPDGADGADMEDTDPNLPLPPAPDTYAPDTYAHGNNAPGHYAQPNHAQASHPQASHPQGNNPQGNSPHTAPAPHYGAPIPPQGAPVQPPGDPMSDRARSLLVPVSDPETTPATPAPAVAPVLPGRPDTERPHVRAPAPQQDFAQGPPCPWCGSPNHPDRHFCNHCAMPLAENGTRAPAPTSWWRRLLGPGSRETPWAGERPRLRRVFDQIGTWITAAVVLTLVILAIVYIPDGVQATRDHFSKRAPVEPDTIKASRSYDGHGPKVAFDKLNNTWWGPGVTQSGQGEWIEVRFIRPTRLLDVIITPGTSTRADQLTKSALPHRVKATITEKDGKVKTRELTLDPGPGGQRRAFRVGEVTKVRFTIESAHAASAKKQVAIAEIELFGRSDGGRT